MEQYDPAALERAYSAVQSGEPRMRAIRTAITAAEQANDTAAAVHFHHELIKESVFSGDRYQALVDFPQYLAQTRKDPVIEQENMWDTLWMYKWIVEASTEFYQIEKVQILRWFSDFRRMLTISGYSLRTWYEKRAIFYQYADRAKMRLDYEDFLRARRDSMSDGEASELDSVVRFETEIGNREKAQKTAAEIIRRRLKTEEVPCKTYYILLTDALDHGEIEEAAQYAEPLRLLCDGQRFQLEPVGMMLCYDALTDPARGLQFYRKNRHLRESSRNPFLCYWFDRGAARLLRAAAGEGLSLQSSTGETLTPEQLLAEAEAAQANAVQLAAKFDARNGSDYFTAHL